MKARKNNIFRIVRQTPTGRWEKDCRVFRKVDSADGAAQEYRQATGLRAYRSTKRAEK
jgi:hypothetical protein